MIDFSDSNQVGQRGWCLRVCWNECGGQLTVGIILVTFSLFLADSCVIQTRKLQSFVQCITLDCQCNNLDRFDGEKDSTRLYWKTFCFALSISITLSVSVSLFTYLCFTQHWSNSHEPSVSVSSPSSLFQISSSFSPSEMLSTLQYSRWGLWFSMQCRCKYDG